MAQELSQLCRCDAPDIADEFGEAAGWLNAFILNSIFKSAYKNELRPIAFGFLRRSQMSIVEYGHGREALLDYLAGDKNRLSVYFRALHHFESMLAQLWQAHEYILKLQGAKLFESGDGSDFQRLHRLHCSSKHLEIESLAEGHLHPVWITNDGLSCSDASLSWHEIVDLIRGLATTCKAIALPEQPDIDGTDEST
jgi:hypothetical protein